MDIDFKHCARYLLGSYRKVADRDGCCNMFLSVISSEKKTFLLYTL